MDVLSKDTEKSFLHQLLQELHKVCMNNFEYIESIERYELVTKPLNTFNNIILNCSLTSDKAITVNECDQNFPSHVILHKKF